MANAANMVPTPYAVRAQSKSLSWREPAKINSRTREAARAPTRIALRSNRGGVDKDLSFLSDGDGIRLDRSAAVSDRLAGREVEHECMQRADDLVVADDPIRKRPLAVRA